jgi:hypothetical protein
MVLGSFGVGAHACGASQNRRNDLAFISFVILPDLTDQDLEKSEPADDEEAARKALEE